MVALIAAAPVSGSLGAAVGAARRQREDCPSSRQKIMLSVRWLSEVAVVVTARRSSNVAHVRKKNSSASSFQPPCQQR
jgi:hypothetical protein